MKPDRRHSPDRQQKSSHFPGQILILTITSLDEEGYGTSEVDGLPVQVAGALAGERVKARILFAGKKHLVAETREVLSPSPARISPPLCTLSIDCCSCPLIAMEYRAQLAWKQGLVTNAIHRYSSLAEAVVSPVIASPQPLGYRTSAKLVIAGKFTSPVIGLYRRNSHNVVDTSDCPLHHPLINRITAATRNGIRKGKVTVFNPRSGNGLLRYLVVRVSASENRAMVIFVTSERNYNEILHLGRFVQREVPEVDVVVQNVNSSSGNVILGEKSYFLSHSHALPEKLDDVSFAISPRSFFQVNSKGAALLYRQVREWAGLTGRETVLDLYCGIGGISLFLAAAAREVVGIEVVETAVEDARRNARLNGFRNCRFESGDVAEILEDFCDERSKIDRVVLNPPRKGCDERVLQLVARLAPDRLVYVSCSPQSLARDLDILSRHGFDAVTVQPVDMFPQTNHVESVALVRKRSSVRNVPKTRQGDVK